MAKRIELPSTAERLAERVGINDEVALMTDIYLRHEDRRDVLLARAQSLGVGFMFSANGTYAALAAPDIDQGLATAASIVFGLTTLLVSAALLLVLYLMMTSAVERNVALRALEALGEKQRIAILGGSRIQLLRDGFISLGVAVLTFLLGLAALCSPLWPWVYVALWTLAGLPLLFSLPNLVSAGMEDRRWKQVASALSALDRSRSG